MQARANGPLPFVVVEKDGAEIDEFSVYLRDLVLTDMSALTVRSYANDLLRWWRLLSLVEVGWEGATRAEIELLVGWMRTAENPQRHRRVPGAAAAGSLNPRTGKQSLARGYAASTINHALSVLSSFYAFHARFGRGPALNPVPASSSRRARLAHRSPLEPDGQHRRAPLRQKAPAVSPRAIPDPLVEELAALMGNHRDRALLALLLSTGARASELLGVRGERVDWTRQQLWVVSKGTRALQPVPVSPEALAHLARYFDEYGTPGTGEIIWRTLRGPSRALTYSALRRVLQRANEVLGTDFTLHDLRHTTIARMTADPALTLPDVLAVTRHQRVSSLDPYLRPRLDEVFDRLQEHYARPRREPALGAGYDSDDFRTVFGG